MPAVLKWLTPDDLPEASQCWPLFIPDDEQIIAAVAGALLPLTYANNWEPFGSVTPAAISAAMKTMFDQAFIEPCGVSMTVDVFHDQKAQGTAGGGLTANSNTTVLYLTALPDNAGNVAVPSGQFVVQPGLYLIDIWHIMKAAAAVTQLCWLEAAVAGGIIVNGSVHNSPTNVQAMARVTGTWRTLVQDTLSFIVRQNVTRATDALGVAANVAGHVEVFGMATFLRIGD